MPSNHSRYAVVILGLTLVVVRPATAANNNNQGNSQLNQGQSQGNNNINSQNANINSQSLEDTQESNEPNNIQQSNNNNKQSPENQLNIRNNQPVQELNNTTHAAKPPVAQSNAPLNAPPPANLEPAAPEPNAFEPAAAVPAPVATIAPAPVPAVATMPRTTPGVTLWHPTNAMLRWVGYSYLPKEKLVRIELLTEGGPHYEIFQEQNKAEQPELVIRYLGTGLRPKLRRAIDASEFRSPVAHIRMREDSADRHVDVVLTLRDPVRGRLFAKQGNIQLSFPIPDKYQSNDAPGKPIKATPAELLSNAKVMPEFEVSSELPHSQGSKVYVPNPVGQTFENAPVDGGIPIENAMENTLPLPDNEGLPANFGNFGNFGPENNNGAALPAPNNSAWAQLRERFIIDAFSLSAVAQDAPASDGFIVENEAMDATAVPAASTPDATAPIATESLGVETDSGGSPSFSGRPVTVEFVAAPMSLVLKTFSEESGNNFTFPSEVGALSVTIYLKNVPWDEALRAILETYSLGMVKIGQNVIRVDRLTSLASYLDNLEKTRESKAKTEKTKILVMRLSHGVAKTALDALNKVLASSMVIDKRITTTADDRTNSIIVEAPPAALVKVKAIIERLDLETAQVEITSRIVEVSRNASNFLGMVWGSSFSFDPGRALGFGSLVFPNSFSSDFTVDPGVRSVSSPGILGMKFGSLNKFLDLDLLLKMEERRGTTNILQTSRVLALDRETANVVAGTKQFFRAAGAAASAPPAGGGTAAPSSGLSEVEFNLKLDVTPEISTNGSIIMKISIESESPSDPAAEALAGKNTRKVTTKMARQSGETAVIGGIYDTKKTKGVVGIPFLSKIPILGALFRSTTTSESQMELLVMVTPTLVANNTGTRQITGSDSEFNAPPAPTSNTKNVASTAGSNLGVSNQDVGTNVDQGRDEGNTNTGAEE